MTGGAAVSNELRRLQQIDGQHFSLSQPLKRSVRRRASALRDTDCLPQRAITGQPGGGPSRWRSTAKADARFSGSSFPSREPLPSWLGFKERGWLASRCVRRFNCWCSRSSSSARFHVLGWEAAGENTSKAFSVCSSTQLHSREYLLCHLSWSDDHSRAHCGDPRGAAGSPRQAVTSIFFAMHSITCRRDLAEVCPGWGLIMPRAAAPPFCVRPWQRQARAAHWFGKVVRIFPRISAGLVVEKHQNGLKALVDA